MDRHGLRRAVPVLSLCSVALEDSEQAPPPQAQVTGTNPRGLSRAIQLPDAIRKLALLLRRYAHWATGPRNPESVAFSCIASSGDVLCPVGHNPGGFSRSPRERCGASGSRGCDLDLPVSRSGGLDPTTAVAQISYHHDFGMPSSFYFSFPHGVVEKLGELKA